jgi:hypothetical protein
MQIIVMHPRFASAKSITLRTRHLVALALLALLLVGGLAAGISALALRYAADQLPFMQDMAASAARSNGARQDKYVKENLAVMAVKLGEMQAQLMRLDALGERHFRLALRRPATSSAAMSLLTQIFGSRNQRQRRRAAQAISKNRVFTRDQCARSRDREAVRRRAAGQDPGVQGARGRRAPRSTTSCPKRSRSAAKPRAAC